MQTGDDLANIVGRIAADLGVETIKITKELAGKLIYVSLMAILNRTKAINPGKTNLNKLVKSEKELKMTDIKLEDLKAFAKKAKMFGLSFAVIKDGDTRHVIYRADDMERAKKVFERVLEQKVKSQSKDIAKTEKGAPALSNSTRDKENVRSKLSKIRSANKSSVAKVKAPSIKRGRER